MMYGYGIPGGMGFGWIFMALFWVIFFVGVLMLVRWVARGGRAGRRSTALDILKERYARGEIDQAQFRRMKDELGG